VQTGGWKKYRRPGITEMRPWVPSDKIGSFSLSAADAENGSPKAGDMIARNPRNHNDRWLVSAAYFFANFAAVEGEVEPD
jgi:hypothetical protein